MEFPEHIPAREDKWIRVEEGKYPPEQQWVLGWFELSYEPLKNEKWGVLLTKYEGLTGFSQYPYWYTDFDDYAYVGQPSHWMPLPEGPTK